MGTTRAAAPGGPAPILVSGRERVLIATDPATSWPAATVRRYGKTENLNRAWTSSRTRAGSGSVRREHRAAGRLDEHLTALAEAVHARHHLLDTVRSAHALAALCVGDDVRINHTISPRYLYGRRGTIVELDDQRATVCLHRPVGRFHTGEIRCPPLALDELAKAS